jgi:hypothetical protein
MVNLKRELIYMFKIFMLLFLFVFLSCSGENQKNVLVKVGDKEITVDEFLNRAELTPRPHFCRSSSDKSKNIVLNTLITEKLFAMQERSESALLNEPNFQAFIRGRKEQYMREALLANMTVNENELDSTEIKEAFIQAGRVYDVAFVKLKTKEAFDLEKNMETYPGIADSLFNAYKLEKLPRHTLRFTDMGFPTVHYELFEKEWLKGDVIGPVRLDEAEHMLLKIMSVSINPAMTQAKLIERKSQVIESLIYKKTNTRWNQLISRVMKNKELHFIPEVTLKVAELWSKNFIKEGKFTQVTGFTDKNYGAFLNDIDMISDKTMFTVNDEAWTVADFREALSSHPLVFRKPDIIPSEFVQHFRFAVVDLIQDVFVTEEAYKQKIDETNSIQRNVAMWEDAFLAMEHRHNYLKMKRSTEGETEKPYSYHALIEGYIENLLKKNKDQIALNPDLFKDIKLTHTDFISRQMDAPYRQTVPLFPILTRNDQLQYGSIIN